MQQYLYSMSLTGETGFDPRCNTSKGMPISQREQIAAKLISALRQAVDDQGKYTVIHKDETLSIMFEPNTAKDALDSTEVNARCEYLAGYATQMRQKNLGNN